MAEGLKAVARKKHSALVALAIALLVGVAMVILAAAFTRSPATSPARWVDAVREIGGALVSGAMIGGAILWFEEVAETMRQQRQDEREAKRYEFEDDRERRRHESEDEREANRQKNADQREERRLQRSEQLLSYRTVVDSFEGEFWGKLGQIAEALDHLILLGDRDSTANARQTTTSLLTTLSEEAGSLLELRILPVMRRVGDERLIDRGMRLADQLVDIGNGSERPTGQNFLGLAGLVTKHANEKYSQLLTAPISD